MRPFPFGGWIFAGLLALVTAVPVLAAPAFPPLTGRVVDAADILPDAVEASITAKLAALEATTKAQVVVATVPDLGGYAIEDYGYQLGRAWGIGREKEDDGVILLVAPNDRKVRIEVGYGLEPVLTDALSGLIIRRQILPAFREGDLPRGVEAGADAIIAQLGLPADQAQAIAAEAAAQPADDGERDGPGFGAVIWILIILFWILAMGSKRGRSSGLGWFILGQLLSAAANSGRHDRGGGWGGGGGGGFGGGGGGFGGGGGGFGGGGSSGGW